MVDQFRRTKILATLGPASDRPGVIEALIAAGVNVVRLNFSHGGADQHAKRIAEVRNAAKRLGREVGVLGDLQGPKIRIEKFAAGKVALAAGQAFTLDCRADAPPNRPSPTSTARGAPTWWTSAPRPRPRDARWPRGASRCAPRRCAW